MDLSYHCPIPNTLSTGGRQQLYTPDVATPVFSLQGDQMYEIRHGGNWGAWFAFIATYLGMCALLVAYVQLKYEHETHSPFQTHIGFIIMSIASIFITLITSGIVVYNNNNFEHFSTVFEVILKFLLCFSAMLSPLALLLLLFIPCKHIWAGYVTVCTVFLALIAVKFTSLKRLFTANHAINFGAYEIV